MWLGWEGPGGVDARSSIILEEAKLIKAAGLYDMLFSEHHGVPKWPAKPLMHAYKIGNDPEDPLITGAPTSALVREQIAGIGKVIARVRG